MAWETQLEFGTPLPTSSPPHHVEVGNADEFRRSSTAVGLLKHREIDMPLMPTAAALSDPPDVLPEIGKQKSKYGLATARFQANNKNQKMGTATRSGSAHFNHTSRCGA